jgi:anaerobic selenocysteine-containing dehydrogenase
VQNTTKFSPPLFERSSESRHDWEILLELETRMKHDGIVGGVRRKLSKQFFTPERILDLGLRFGPYGARLNPFSKGLTLRKVRKAVHGIDLGPLASCLPGRLRTTDKLIDLAPGVFVKDVERVKTKFLKEAAYESNGHLLLIGRRHLRSNNSWMHNSERLVKGNPAKPACTILMHPMDAANRDLLNGQKVLVRSRVGSIVLPVEISEEIMRGVVSIPHGWGHDRAGNQQAIAQQHAGASINDLTDPQAVDALCGTAAFNGTAVTVSACLSTAKPQ